MRVNYQINFPSLKNLLLKIEKNEKINHLTA